MMAEGGSESYTVQISLELIFCNVIALFTSCPISILLHIMIKSEKIAPQA